MKVRILFLFAFVLTLSLASTPPAQAQTSREFVKFKRTLGLTESQKKDWSTLDRSVRVQIANIKKSSLSQEQKGKKIKAIKKLQNDRLKEILTKSQWNKLMAYRKEHRGAN